MAKMGRPISENPHKHVLSIRFTDDEYEELKQRAAKYGLTIAETVRKEIRLKASKKS